MTTTAERPSLAPAADYLSCSVPVEVIEDDGEGQAWLRMAGEWQAIQETKCLWDLDGYWVGEQPVVSMHFQATLSNGRQVLLSQDLVEGTWQQRVTLGVGVSS